MYLSDWDTGVSIEVIEALAKVIECTTEIYELAIEVEWGYRSQRIMTEALIKNETVTKLVLKV